MTIWVPTLAQHGPRYRQIADAMATAIESGELTAGERLPPQRQLADRLGVTIGTVTRAYTEAQRRGLVVSRVGSGSYVRSGESQANSTFRASRPRGTHAVDLSMAFPPPHPWRADGLQQALGQIMASPDALQAATEYQHEAGEPQHRSTIAAWQGRLGLPDDPHRILITQGGQHGIHLVLHTLTQPGELVAADALTYPGFVCASQQAHLRQLAVPMDDQGMDTTALERLCERQPPRLVYVTPDINNPTTTVLSEARRRHLVELARTHDIWIIEDAVQYLPEPLRGTPLVQLAPERTLHIFSTSKVLAGGLRIGTLSVPEPLQARFCSALRSQSWMVPPLMVDTACHWMENPDSQALLTWQTQELEARRAMTLERLAAYQPRSREGSSLIWLPLPAGLRSGQIKTTLAERGLLVSTPEPFCMGSEPVPQALRLCLGPPDDQATLLRGLDILQSVLEEPPGSRWGTM